MTDSTVSIPTLRVTQPWVQAWTGGCPISCLPDEILAEIFVQCAYGPCKGSFQDLMLHRIGAIYHRVYTLISVCATWRRIGLGCPNLWLVVPIINIEYPPPPRVPSSKTILQRASSRNLHLAVSVDKLPPEELKNLADHWHRFGIINFCSESITGSEISAVLGRIIEHSSPGSISRLSLRKQYLSFPSSYNIDTGPDPQIAEFVSSLSVFRISKVAIKWTEIMFSHRLVELQIDQITANSDSEIRSFFAALSSACELKDLKLIAIIFDPVLLDTSIPLEVVSLPKLEFLYVERGCRNILDLILSHIARGPYHLTLNLLPYTTATYPFSVRRPDFEPFYTFLRSVPIDKLILNGYKKSPWQFGTGLQRTLESTPNLKTLVLNKYVFKPEVLMGIQRPTLSTNGDSFPHLTTLELRNSDLETSLADLKPGFEAIFSSHCIHKMVLGGVFRSVRGADRYPISYDDEVVKWMRDSVPQFSLVDFPYGVPENSNAWQLWDI